MNENADSATRLRDIEPEQRITNRWSVFMGPWSLSIPACVLILWFFGADIVQGRHWMTPLAYLLMSMHFGVFIGLSFRQAWTLWLSIPLWAFMTWVSALDLFPSLLYSRPDLGKSTQVLMGFIILNGVLAILSSLAALLMIKGKK